MTAESAKAIPAARAPWPWRDRRLARDVSGGARAGLRHRLLGMALAGSHAGALAIGCVAGASRARHHRGSPLRSCRKDGDSAPDTSAPALQGDTRLLGVFAGADGTGPRALSLAGRGPVLVRSGEEIAKDVTLLEVRPDGVRIRDRGETRDLALRTNAAAATRPSRREPRPQPLARPSARVRAAGRLHRAVYRINAELLTGMLRGRTAGLRSLTPVPGGLAVREGTQAASMLGMKPGDSLAQANGIALKGIDDIVDRVREAADREPAGPRRRRRDGKPAAWVFVNAGACPG